MKKTIFLLLLFSISASAFAVDGSEVMYAGGTVRNLKTGAMGTLDVTSASELTFVSSDGKVVVPYASVTSFFYSEQVAHHLGVLPAIAVGLLKARHKRHFFHIVYQDSSGGVEALVLEISKEAQGPMRTAIESRIPRGTCVPSCSR